MSIKSLFENIANAIKNVYGTTDTLTPAEMPQAITNFNSIFQTKNLSAPISGQTTVEGCLSSLSSDLSELNSRTTLSTHVFNTKCVLYKYGNVVTFVIRNARKAELEALIIPQDYRPLNVSIYQSINFVIESYDVGGQSPAVSYLWITNDGSVSVDPVIDLLTGTVTWMTE